MSSRQIARFRETVWSNWRKNGRHGLAWRKTKNPYRILVSEMMLQQTQVPRVEGKYKEFLKTFPTVQVLAKAPFYDVLKIWNGLGYNRRAKYLHDTAKIVVGEFEGDFKRALEHPLPGVGPYTRSAVRVFSFNEPDILIETNVRTVFIHHFFPDTRTVSDSTLLAYIRKAGKGQDPRTWHSALMDYGAHLKKNGVRNNARSAHYTKQSKFEGSLRQVRGAILKAHTLKSSMNKLRSEYADRFEKAFNSLVRDGLIVKEKRWNIA